MLVRSLKRTMGFQFGSDLLIVRHDQAQVVLPDELRADAAFQFAVKHGEVSIIEQKPTQPAAVVDETSADDSQPADQQSDNESEDDTESESTDSGDEGSADGEGDEGSEEDNSEDADEGTPDQQSTESKGQNNAPAPRRRRNRKNRE